MRDNRWDVLEPNVDAAAELPPAQPRLTPEAGYTIGCGIWTGLRPSRAGRGGWALQQMDLAIQRRLGRSPNSAGVCGCYELERDCPFADLRTLPNMVLFH